MCDMQLATYIVVVLPFRCDDLRHQQESTTERTEHLEKLEKAKNDPQEAFDGELKKCQERCT